MNKNSKLRKILIAVFALCLLAGVGAIASVMSDSAASVARRTDGVTRVERGIIKVELNQGNFSDFFDVCSYFITAEKDADGEYSYVERGAFCRLKDGYSFADGCPEPVISAEFSNTGPHDRLCIQDYDLEAWDMGVSLEEFSECGGRNLDLAVRQWVVYKTLEDALLQTNGITFTGIEEYWDKFYSSGNVVNGGNFHIGYDVDDLVFEDATGAVYLTVDCTGDK